MWLRSSIVNGQSRGGVDMISGLALLTMLISLERWRLDIPWGSTFHNTFALFDQMQTLW